MSSKLNTPFEFKGLRSKNRIVMAPMATNKANQKGEVTQELIDYYEKRAQNEVGMIIVEHSYIDTMGKRSIKQLGIDKDKLIEGLSKLVKVVHNYDVLIGLQINHCGSKPKKDVLKKG